MKSLTQFLASLHNEVLIMGLGNAWARLSCLSSFFPSEKYFFSFSLSFKEKATFPSYYNVMLGFVLEIVLLWKSPRPKAIWNVEGLYQLITVTEETHGRNREAGTKAQIIEEHSLVAFSFWVTQACFLIQPRTTSPGVVLLTVSWAFPHQSSWQKLTSKWLLIDISSQLNWSDASCMW